jgi:hypothetical protein
MAKEKVQKKIEGIYGSFKAGMMTITEQTKIIILVSIRNVLSLILGWSDRLKMSWTIIWEDAKISPPVVERVAARRAIIKIPTIHEGRAIRANPGTDSFAPPTAIAGIAMPTSAKTTQGKVDILLIKEAQKTPREPPARN